MARVLLFRPVSKIARMSHRLDRQSPFVPLQTGLDFTWRESITQFRTVCFLTVCCWDAGIEGSTCTGTKLPICCIVATLLGQTKQGNDLALDLVSIPVRLQSVGVQRLAG